MSKIVGTLAAWNADKVFGFIRRDDGEADVFIHRRGFASPAVSPKAGERIEFDTEPGRDGRLRAINARVVASQPVL